MTAYATAEEIAAGAGTFRFGTPSALTDVETVFVNNNGVVSWSHPTFANAEAVFALNPATGRVEVFYAGAPPAGYRLLTLRVGAVVRDVTDTCDVIQAEDAAAAAASSTALTGTGSATGNGIATATAAPLPGFPTAIGGGSGAAITGGPISAPLPGGGLVNVGIEIIVHIIVTIVDCPICPDGTSLSTATGKSTIRPVYNTALPGQPCYVCLFAAEGVACPTDAQFTVTSTVIECPVPTAAGPVVVQPCSDCEVVTLVGVPSTPAGTAPWWKPTGVSAMSMPGMDMGVMTAKTVAVVGTGGVAVPTGVVPTSTGLVPFTGAGSEVRVGGALAGVVGVAMLML
jgi:hypothetical protein